MTKTVLITGASRGIGYQTALYLAKSGYNLVLHCNKNIAKIEELKETIKTINPITDIRLMQFDIRNRHECEEKLIKDIEEFGMYYGVILNAGINKDAAFPAMENTDWDDVIDTNLNGLYNVLRPLCMPMIQNRTGRIIALTSVSALTGNRGQVNYSASKAGIIGAIKALSRELAKRKITANCVAPGIIDTDMTQNIASDIVKELVPMQRMGTAKEVASLINYLLSDDAGYITGQVISVNGGMYI